MNKTFTQEYNPGTPGLILPFTHSLIYAKRTQFQSEIDNPNPQISLLIYPPKARSFTQKCTKNTNFSSLFSTFGPKHT
jgi:hypothetical protein